MKTAEEHWRDLDRCVTSTQEVVLIGLRDAEHRAELERLKGELAEAKHLIAEAAEATCPQRFSEPGRPAKFSDCGSCWTCRAQRFLAAPPPAESTPVLCEQHGREDCSRPDHAAPPDDIRARLDDYERRLTALEAKGEPGTHAFVDCPPNCGDGCSLTGRCHRSRGNFSTSYGACGEARESAVHAKGAKP